MSKRRNGNEEVIIHCVIGNDARAWVHTHGMDRHGLPELEMRDVPGVVAKAAAGPVRYVSEAMLEPGTGVRLGETLENPLGTPIRFVNSTPIPGEEAHYQTDRWQIVEDWPHAGVCCECSRSLAEQN